MSYEEPNEMSTKYKVVNCKTWKLEETLNEYSYSTWMLHSVVFVGGTYDIIFTDVTYF
jgi:hypothetical protein